MIDRILSAAIVALGAAIIVGLWIILATDPYIFVGAW